MLPRAKELRRQWFEWPEAVFGRFNFHRDDQIDAAVDQLLSGEPPAVLVLAGEEGIGRGYFCEAVRHRARGKGHPIGVWHLDLDGFEPEIAKPLERYLVHLLEQQEAEQQVLEARKRILGGEHPATLRAMRNLAAMLRDQGDVEGAAEIEKKLEDDRS